MKTNSKKILSVFLSLLMTFMCMTSAVVNSAGARTIFYFAPLTASAGQDVQLDLLVDNPIAIQKMSNMILTAPDGFEITGMSETSQAFNGSVTYQTDGKALNFSITSNGTVNSGTPAVSINLHVSESCPVGNYAFQWKKTVMSCITADGYNYTPTINYGIVTVSDSVVEPATTTTTEPSTTTQTTTTETTTTTTTTTTVSAYVEVTINSYPTKTAYTVGEELDLSGGMFQSQGMRSDGVRFGNSPSKMENNANVDTSEFDSTKAGTYKIYIRVSDNGMTAETFFEVTVSEPETTTTETTTTTTTTTTAIHFETLNLEIASLPNKTVYQIGEELDLTGIQYSVTGRFSNGMNGGTNKKPDVDTSEFDNTKAGTYKIYASIEIDGLRAETSFEVTVSEPETTTTETTTTTTTTTTVSTYIEIGMISYPTKTAYTIGEELDLSGGGAGGKGVAPDGTLFEFGFPISDFYDNVYIDTSEFDNTKAGTYKIYIRISDYGMTAETFFEVTVSEPETTTQTTTTETTTTTTTTKYTYSVKFVDEETGQAVSGVRYNIVSYDYAHDLALIVQTSGITSKSYDFISDTAYVSLSSTEQAIPDGYYIADGATRWELSANNPDLTVYLRKSATTSTMTTTIETTTTTTQTTTTETTTTTTVSAYMEVSIIAYPTKTAYTIGEELDLSGGAFCSEGTDSNGGAFCSIIFTMENNDKVDTSEFDSTKAGTYRIYVRMQYEDLYAENYFEVTVTDSSANFKLGDVDGDGMVNAVDATSILTEYALLSTGKTGTFNDIQNKSADVDGDGMINAVDATFVLSYYAFLSTGGNSDMATWLTTQS